jgi:hypothetical protein
MTARRDTVVVGLDQSQIARAAVDHAAAQCPIN